MTDLGYFYILLMDGHWLTIIDDTSQELVPKILSIHLHTVFQGVYVPESSLKMTLCVHDQLEASSLV